jgi:hypothetical protein
VEEERASQSFSRALQPRATPKKAEIPEECQQYRWPRREDVVKPCAELGGLRHLAVKNVVELAQMLELEDDLEKAVAKFLVAKFHKGKD